MSVTGKIRKVEMFEKSVRILESVDESLTMFAPIVARAREAGIAVRGYLSMCFGDPWEGEVPVPRVFEVATRMLALGCTELSLGDTIGVATPGRVVAVLDALIGAGIAVDRCALSRHLWPSPGQHPDRSTTRCHHDRRLGRRPRWLPYAGSATGNLATEDLLWQFQGLGVETGIDLQKMVDTSVWLAKKLGRPSPSRTVTALAG